MKEFRKPLCECEATVALTGVESFNLEGVPPVASSTGECVAQEIELMSTLNERWGGG